MGEASAETMLSSPRVTSLRELAALFLKLGVTAFGGPAVHIALMEDEVVARRKWMSRETFLDLVAATNLIPGPNSTELAIHIGQRRAGLAGLIVAGFCFILPAALIVSAIAWAYVRFGKLPAVEGVLYGVKPVVIAVVAQALWRLGRAAIKSKPLAVVGVAAVAAAALRVNELVVLFAAAAVMIGVEGRGRPSAVLPAVMPLAAPSLAGAAAGGVAIGPLFLVFLKIGSVLFGSGYVLLAFLRADLVQRLHWLTESQLLDAVVVGQATPGPVFTTATFIGYILAGPPGAAAATVGIFLPGFVFVALTAPVLPRLRQSKITGAALDGLNVASFALMAVVTFQLARSTLRDPVAIVLAAVSAILLLRFKVKSTWLIVAGAAIGLLARRGG